MFKINSSSIVVLILLAIGSSRWCLADIDPPQCGRQAGGALCRNQLCCSYWGFCGSTDIYCGEGCQSQCTGSNPPLPPPILPPPFFRPPPPPPPSPPPPSPPPPSPPPPPPPSPPPPSPPPPPPPSPPPPSPPPPPPVQEYLISRRDFNAMLRNRDNIACESRGFYTYEAFVVAARTFPKFGNEGSEDEKKRDIAAFFGQTSHETSGRPDVWVQGPYEWGYCNVTSRNPFIYCEPNSEFPCAPGKKYFGRGPFHLQGNELYGKCGKAIGVDLLNNPDLVATDAVISFKTAIWFWMTPPPQLDRNYVPPGHDVMTGIWVPASFDIEELRFPGYGMTTYVYSYVIRRSRICGGKVTTVMERNRVGYYTRYCDILGVGYGDNLNCFNYKTPWTLAYQSS